MATLPVIKLTAAQVAAQQQQAAQAAQVAAQRAQQQAAAQVAAQKAQQQLAQQQAAQRAAQQQAQLAAQQQAAHQAEVQRAQQLAQQQAAAQLAQQQRLQAIQQQLKPAAPAPAPAPTNQSMIPGAPTQADFNDPTKQAQIQDYLRQQALVAQQHAEVLNGPTSLGYKQYLSMTGQDPNTPWDADWVSRAAALTSQNTIPAMVARQQPAQPAAPIAPTMNTAAAQPTGGIQSLVSLAPGAQPLGM